MNSNHEFRKRSIEGYINLHTGCAKNFEFLIQARKENNKPVLRHIAAIYQGAIANGLDAESELEKIQNSLDQQYRIKFLEDKCQFYKRIQKKIIEEFDLNLNDIYKELIVLSKNELSRDKLSENKLGKRYEQVFKQFNFPKEMLKEAPEQLKILPKNKEFCESVVKGTYKFPSLESFENQEVSIFEIIEDKIPQPIINDEKTETKITILNETKIGKNTEKNKKKVKTEKEKKLVFVCVI